MAQTSTEHDQLATWDEEHLLHPWSFDGTIIDDRQR